MLTDRVVKNNTQYFKQQGAATLVVAVVLLVIVLGISFFTAEVVISEKKVTANVYRAKQAFHAAQAGIDYGIAYARDGLDQNGDSFLDLTTASGAQKTASVGSAKYTVSLMDVSSDTDMSLIEVTSEGFSDDEQIKRKIYVLVGKVPLVPNPPDLPLVARGNVDLTGNLRVHNVFSNLNVWSGEILDNWGSTDTYIRDPDWTDGKTNDVPNWDGSTDLNSYLGDRPLSDVPTILSSTKTTRGPDAIEGDVNLSEAKADDFTVNFFGKTLDELVAIAKENGYSGDQSFLEAKGSAVNGNIIHLSDGKLNADFGTREKPVIIVVDVPLKMTGGTINGLLIVDSVERLAGGAKISGGLVSQNAISGGAGTADVYYDEKVITEIKDFYTIEQVRGSWRDW